jgi:hypothetical protein
MNKSSFRYFVTRDIMLFGVALEALTLYPSNPVIFLIAVPLSMSSVLHLFSLLADQR